MTWWLWLIVGIISGLVLAFGGIALGSYVITHNDKLMAYFSGRLIRTMIQPAIPKQEAKK